VLFNQYSVLMKKLIINEFGIIPIQIIKINGYENYNYIIITESKKYIFKCYQDLELYELIKAETEALLYINNKFYPTPIPFLNGQFVSVHKIRERKTICRMLSYIEGEFMGEINHSKEMFISLGTFLANLDLSFNKWSNPYIKSREWEWEMQNFDLFRKHIIHIKSIEDRRIVHYFINQYIENVVPFFSELRKAIIHNDANEWNVLFKNGAVSGIIDFGDITYSHLINELAIAIAYACLGKESPLKWAAILVDSYNKTLPLKANEVQVLYYSVAMRLCMSICNSSFSQKKDPLNLYISKSQKLAIKLLNNWIKISPIEAEKIFTSLIGITIKKDFSINELIKKRQKYISPVVSLSYDLPIHMKKSAFQYMYDSEGRTFLDAYNNIPHVGHSHPYVVEAGQRQMASLNTNTRYLYNSLEDYSEKLISTLPKQLNKVFFVNSGSEASDLAIRMARFHTNNNKLIVVQNGYHGHTQTGIEISDYKFSNKKGIGKKNHIIRLEIPNTFNGKYTDDQAGYNYAKDAIHQINLNPNSIAAFISEPILGFAGQVPLAKDYLKKLYPVVRKNGGVCISDEVQTGFGRLGDCFWGYELHGVTPDIIILGKPMANGHPMGAVVTTSEIANSFENGIEFFSSFGGNPVSCEIALAVLEVVENEKLQKNAKEVGEYYKSLLIDLKSKHTWIKDVRGSGLFLGVELSNQTNLKCNKSITHIVKNELKKNKILVSSDGPNDNVIKTKPPMCFTKQNAKEVVEAMDSILKSI
jgi:ethanolamine-phosphate phospho-lyase